MSRRTDEISILRERVESAEEVQRAMLEENANLRASLAEAQRERDFFDAERIKVALREEDILARLAAAVEVLREVEWACRDDFDEPYCSICDAGRDRWPPKGHAPGCRLAAVLAGGAP